MILVIDAAEIAVSGASIPSRRWKLCRNSTRGVLSANAW